HRLEALVTSPERKAPVVAQADGKAVALAQRPLRHGLRLAPGARAAVVEMDRPRDRRRVSTEFLGERTDALPLLAVPRGPGPDRDEAVAGSGRTPQDRLGLSTGPDRQARPPPPHPRRDPPLQTGEAPR